MRTPAALSENLDISGEDRRSRPHAPEPVIRSFLVPRRSRLEVARTSRQMLPHYVFIQRNAQPWLIGDRNESLVDDGLLDAFHHVLPPGHIQRVILAGQKILRGCGAM